MPSDLPIDAFLDAARMHIQTVLDRASVSRATDPSPLLANCLDRTTLQPARFRAVEGQEIVVCDLAGQQSLLRAMADLSALTSERTYHDRALAMLRFALRELRPYGLLLWGNHAAVDLLTGRALHLAEKGKMHELKCHYPSYEMMWNADPAATQWFIEAFWQAHVTDWSRLDFNRHGRIDSDMHTRVGDPWGRPYVGGDVFFPSRLLGFLNTGSDLYYAAGMLHHLNHDPGPLTWANRLLDRFAQTRHPKTRLSGYIYTRLHYKFDHAKCVDRAFVQFADQFPDHVCAEGTLITGGSVRTICGHSALARLHIAELLGDAGANFLRQAIDDLLAFAQWTYEFADNTFHPCFTDAYRLTGQAIAKSGYYGPAGQVFRAAKADLLLLWAYARGWRLSREKRLWDVARNIALDRQLGDIGAAPGDQPALRPGPELADPLAIFALLELDSAFPDGPYLATAGQIGQNILRTAFDGRLLAPPAPAARLTTRVGPTSSGSGKTQIAPDPSTLVYIDSDHLLSLLHVAARVRNRTDAPLGYCSTAGRHCPSTGWTFS